MNEQRVEKRPGVEKADWVGAGGLLKVHGVEHYLPTMSPGDLNALHTSLALEADLIRNKLAEREVEQAVAGSLAYDTMMWRNRARFALNMKKKQMSAIHAEFSRRKSNVPPVDEYAFTAVVQLWGQEGLEQALALARSMQSERAREIVRTGRAISHRLADRKDVCGAKIPYETKELGLDTLDGMGRGGADTFGMVVYGPCPWCGKYHIGHKKNYRRKWLKKLEQEQAAAGKSS